MNQSLKMTLEDFRQRALANGVVSAYHEQAETRFWNGLNNRGNVNVPVYAVDNERTIYPTGWPYFNMNKLSPKARTWFS